MDHKLSFNQGAQNIRTFVVSALGFAERPSAATLQIVDQRYTDTDSNYSVVDAAVATIDSASTVTTVACGRSSSDPATITLSSVTNVAAGRRYLLSNALGQSEVVTAVAVNVTTKTIRARTEPQHLYPVGATFEGLEVSGAVPAEVCNDDKFFDAKLAAIWTFTGVGPTRIEEHIELVRPQPSWASVDDLTRLESGLASRNADLESALAQAHFDFGLDLRGAGLNPYTFNPGPLGTGAVTYLAAYHALKNREEDAIRERAKAHHDRYKELRLQLTVGKDKAGVTEVDKVTGAAKAPDIRSLFSGL